MYIYKLVEIPYNAYKKLKFVRFSNHYINTTKRFYSINELRSYASNRDAVIVGSDQVWNASMIRQDPAYFLKFIEPRKKISYAASLGISKLTKSQRSFYADMLYDFDHVSVREPSGARLVEEILGKKAQVLLDPTLLLTRQDWEKICPPPRKKPYIFAYILRHDPEVQAFLYRLKKQTGLPVCYVSRGYVSALRDGATSVPSPQEWVRDLMGAKYVVTTSFHGTAFSVNFQKTFFTFVEGDITNDTNSRQVDFLNTCGLTSRLNPPKTGVINLEKPDFTSSVAILEVGRKQARTYLEQTLDSIVGETCNV